MDPVLTTPRLKLTLVATQPPQGTPEFAWLHELHSNKQTRFWSIMGASKTIEDTEKSLAPLFLAPDAPPNTHRILYAVHQLAPNPNDPPILIGTITLVSLASRSLHLPPPLVPAPSPTHPFLTLELAYQFLPSSWHQGFAPEALRAVIDACGRNTHVWAPYERVWVRAIVNSENGPSARVMEKVGFAERGVFEWKGEGKGVFVGGRWRTEDRLRIFGAWVVGGPVDEGEEEK